MKFGEYLTEQIHEPEYIIRENYPGNFTVSKWTKGKRPTDIYTVRKSKKGWAGTCLQAKRGKECKHIRMVKEWIKQGKPEALDVSKFKSYLKKEIFREADSDLDMLLDGFPQVRELVGNQEMAIGMLEYDEPPFETALIFTFDYMGTHPLTMEGMRFPLDILYFNEDGDWVDSIHALPGQKIICPKTSFRYAVEIASVEEAFLLDEDMKVLYSKAKKFAIWAAKKIVQIKIGIQLEKKETKDMMVTFFKLLRKKLWPGKVDPNKLPTEHEIRAALEQLKDIGKVAAIVGILLIPFGVDDLSIIGIELLARRFGLTFMPSALKGII